MTTLMPLAVASFGQATRTVTRQALAVMLVTSKATKQADTLLINFILPFVLCFYVLLVSKPAASINAAKPSMNSSAWQSVSRLWEKL
jgi:hypothetical protein